MKKTHKKLHLSTQTIRQLSDIQLGHAHGAGLVTSQYLPCPVPPPPPPPPPSPTKTCGTVTL